MKKIINFFIKKYFSFPTLKFLLSCKNQFLKKTYINFWISLSKRNVNFLNFFFHYKYPDKLNINKDIRFNINSINENIFESLKYNGLVVIENALEEKEHKNIIKIFDTLKVKEGRSLRKTEHIIRYSEEHEINNFPNLKKLSDLFTKKVFGKPLNTSAEFYLHYPLKLPEPVINGDNNMHIDRFLPNMKLYYSPYEINEDSAPFCYALSSHIINKEYLDFVKNTTKFSDADSNSDYFLKQKKEAICKENSLIVALTNGFHGRKSFLKFTKRQVVFLQYHKSFNKFSLLFG